MSSSRSHPWHLTRCGACRTFVISSAPKCPNCGEWRPSARAMSVMLPVMAAVMGIAALVFLAETAIKIERLRAERVSALTESAARDPVR